MMNIVRENGHSFIVIVCHMFVHQIIQDHQLKCTECIKEVDLKGFSIDEWDDFLKSHAEQHPNSSTKFTFNYIFDTLILTPGSGHIEMNMA